MRKYLGPKTLRFWEGPKTLKTNDGNCMFKDCWCKKGISNHEYLFRWHPVNVASQDTENLHLSVKLYMLICNTISMWVSSGHAMSYHVRWFNGKHLAWLLTNKFPSSIEFVVSLLQDITWGKFALLINTLGGSHRI